MAIMHIDMEPHETLSVGDADITFEHKSGRRVRVKVEAPEDVEITLPGVKTDKE